MTKGRHPVRVEMKAIWRAEAALREKEVEVQKQKRELNRKAVELQEQLEEKQRQLQIEVEKVAEHCNVAPSTPLDTVGVKWMRPRDTNKPDAGLDVIDFATEPENAPAESTPP